jgi:hypothetical protein
MMAEVITHRSAENRQYVRQLLGRKQPGFAALLELALILAEWELWSPDLTAASAGTSLPWAGLDNLTGRLGSR